MLMVVQGRQEFLDLEKIIGNGNASVPGVLQEAPKR